MEDGVVLLTQGSKHKGDRAIPQFNVTCLAHDTISVGDGEVGESAVVFFKPIGTLCVGLA